MRMLKKFIKKNGTSVAIALTICGFIGIPILLWFASVTVIGIGVLFIMLFISGVLGLQQWKYVRHYIHIAYNQFAMYAFVGFGVTFLNFILLLNYCIPIKTHSETYSISKKGFNVHIVFPPTVDYKTIKRNLSSYLDEHVDDLLSANTVTVKFDTGIFGFDVITGCSFN
jgi:hypothetical protein